MSSWRSSSSLSPLRCATITPSQPWSNAHDARSPIANSVHGRLIRRQHVGIPTTLSQAERSVGTALDQQKTRLGACNEEYR